MAAWILSPVAFFGGYQLIIRASQLFPALTEGFLGFILGVGIWAAFMGAIVWAVWGLYVWLAIITLKTPPAYKRVSHGVGAALLAALPTFLWSNPFDAVVNSFVYLEYHGYFVVKLILWAAVVVLASNVGIKAAGDNPFPRYPLRWCALLVVGSLFAGAFLRPDGDVSSLYHYYGLEAYFVGPVLVAYLTSWMVVSRSQGPRLER